jgi:hypothetical protein
LAGTITLVVCALLSVGPASAATPKQSRSATAAPSTTAPAVLPTNMNAPLPHSGSDSARLAGLAVSCILIGWGVCSFGRGVRLAHVRH